MKKIIIWAVLIIATSPLKAQQGTSEEKADLTTRIMVEIQNFMDYITIIGAAEESLEVRKRGIELCLKLFSSDAVIEEQSKNSSYKKPWTPEAYLQSMLYRGERSPVMVSFEVYDELLPEELEMIEHEDGSITYRGEMIFRQYYCKLKDIARRKEPTAGAPEVNCEYSDYTDKKVAVVIKRDEDTRGKFWITRISEIRVLRVF